MDNKLKIFYIPIDTKEHAVVLVDQLIKDKLIACANIIGPGLSVFHGDKGISHEEEFYIIAKTSVEKSEIVRQTILEKHPYDTPCVVELGTSSVNQSYFNWIIDKLG